MQLQQVSHTPFDWYRCADTRLPFFLRCHTAQLQDANMRLESELQDEKEKARQQIANALSTFTRRSTTPAIP